MKKAILIIVLIIAFFIIYFLQANFFSWFTISGIKPNLFVIFILFIGLFAGKKIGAILGLILGLYLDLVIGKTKRKIKNKVKKHFYGTLNSPETVCTVELSIQHEESLIKKRISFDIRGFFQSNLFVLEKAISQIYKYISNIPTNKKRALDFYSGAGTFSVFLADFFENITLVEHNRDALVYAEQNLIKTKHTSYGVSGEFWVQQYANKDILQNGNYDLVIIDPPRSGIEKPVIDFLCKSNIPRIISISCDPATHARDCAILMKAGYKIKQMYLLDFYPNTSHIESMAFLEK